MTGSRDSDVRRAGPPGLWPAATAAGLATVALWLAFYRLVVRFDEGTIVLGISGWHYALALVAWSAVLAVAALCAAGRLAADTGRMRRALGAGAMAAGLLAVVSVLVAVVDRPTSLALASSAVEHLDADELRRVVTPSVGWTRRSGGVEVGAGLYLLLAATLLSVIAGSRGLRAMLRGSDRCGGPRSKT